MKRKVDHIDLNKHLTQQELLDYNSGVLGSEEMYRLELHLNECELCSEALEGINQVNHPRDIIYAINDAIRPVKQEATIPRNYLAIAASIVLIAAVGFTFWMLNPTGKDKSLAVNTLEEKSKDTTTKEEEKQESDNFASKEDTVSYAMEEVPSSEKEELSDETIPEATPPPALTTQPAQTDKIRSEPVSNNTKLAKQEDIPEDQVADAELAEEVILDTNKQDSAGDEANGMAAPSVAQERMVSSQTRQAKKTAGTQPATEPIPDQKEPEPIGGMSNYKSYLENNIVYPQSAIDNKIKGAVVLEVTINPNGTIKTITIVKGLGYGCDEEAKRLVNEGPEWKPAAEDGKTIEATQQIKVRFKL